MKSDQYSEKAVRKNKRDRYWSVMLVGDHGRIIPFRRFKGLAVSGVCLLVVSIVALIIVSLLYAHQRKKTTQSEIEVQALRGQVAELRDEKDLYLTQLIVKQKQSLAPSKKNPPAKKARSVPMSETEAEVKAPKATAKKTPAAAKPAPAPEKVKWAADIRRFKATYYADKKILKAEFRIYNTSKPRKPLAGRTVVVFKNLDDMPIHWFPVPRVQLKNGEPIGDKGQSFKINNYRTVQFRAYGLKPPVKFNTATVFIFSDKGQLLISKDFGFKIADEPLPVKVKPQTPPKPNPVKPNPAKPAGVPKESNPGPTGPTPARDVSPASPKTSVTPPEPPVSRPADDPVKTVDDAVAIPEPKAPVTDSKIPASQKNGDGTPSGIAPSTPPADMPEPDMNPKTQGEPQ